jgi:nitroreductase
MDALKALQTRVSAPRLDEPGPSTEQLQQLWRAAARAADHALLRPWRFLVISGKRREALGELFVQATLKADPDTPAAKLDKTRGKPLRAPTIITVVAHCSEHPNVPAIEQQLSAAAAAQNIINAAYALGLGAMWRTGSMAYADEVRQGLGLQDNESIVGFLYLGQPAGPLKPVPELDVSELVSHW